MPRAVYDVEDKGSIRDKIGGSGNLIVEKIISEDDDEDEEDEEA
jgi:FAS-associated factor 2